MRVLTLFAVVWLSFIGLAVGPAGCGPSPTERLERAEKAKIAAFPPDAKVVEKKSEYWWVVETGGNSYLAQWQYNGYVSNWVLTPYKK